MYTMDIGVRQGSVFRLDPHPECNAFPPGSDLLPRKYIENLRIADLGGEFPDHGQHVAYRHAYGENAGKIPGYRRIPGNRPELWRPGEGKRRLDPDLPVIGRPGDFRIQAALSFPRTPQ